MAIGERESLNIKKSGSYNMPPIRIPADAATIELPFTPRIFKEILIKKFFVPNTMITIMTDDSEITTSSNVGYIIGADGVAIYIEYGVGGGIQFTSNADDSKVWNVIRGD